MENHSFNSFTTLTKWWKGRVSVQYDTIYEKDQNAENNINQLNL